MACVALYPVSNMGVRGGLHYAKAEDLRDYQHLVAIRGEVMVQGWRKNGDEAVDLRLTGSTTGAVFPMGLQGLF